MMQWQKAKAMQARMEELRRVADADPHTQQDREVARLHALEHTHVVPQTWRSLQLWKRREK